MSASEFKAPAAGFRFRRAGMRLTSPPDAIPPEDGYAYVQNVRFVEDHAQTRPGWTKLTASPLDLAAVTNIRAYSTLGTDNLPRWLARTMSHDIYLDTGTKVGDWGSGNVDLGASMIPFRPGASPQSWMYVADSSDYRKYSAPGAADAVTEHVVGVPEPQAPPDAAPAPQSWVQVQPNGVSWAVGGTASSLSSAVRTTDTIVAVAADPASASRLSVQVGASVQYQRGECIGATPDAGVHYTLFIIEDVIPPLISGITISAIRYQSGTTGACVIVPSTINSGPGKDGADSSSILSDALLAGLRRGALVTIGSGGGAELCYVRSVTRGPDGQVCFETSTTGTHAAAEVIVGHPVIIVNHALAPTYLTAGIQIDGDSLGVQTFSNAAGLGWLTASAATNPFVFAGLTFQQDDYLHLSVKVDDLSKLNEIKLIFDVSGAGSPTFADNAFYYAIRPNDLVAGVANASTQLGVAQQAAQNELFSMEGGAGGQTTLGSGQWSEIWFPISALQRIGNDQTRTLANTAACRVLVNASATISVSVSSICSVGGGQPDVGDSAPYLYCVVGRSSLTGARSNRSPITRYGTVAHRQHVTLTIAAPSTAVLASGVDQWEVYRYGGSVHSWRRIGQVTATAGSPSTFDDNYSDPSANAGMALETDNYEPWPTVDLPLTGTAVVVCGTQATVTTTQSTILRWLPGTQVQLGGQRSYTLWTRPTLITGTTYLLQFVENAGTGSNVALYVQEPTLAAQRLPYLWGPDAAGTFFGAGDPLRPGTVYFSKSNNPDAAPDRYNRELTPPSEPILGGEIIDGKSVAFSTERSWDLYPAFSSPERYTPVQNPTGCGLAAPFAHCTDGRFIYFVAKDSVRASSTGGAYSLTHADLYPLFPHEGVPGSNQTRSGYTIYAPEYKYAGSFRLAIRHGYLYFDYYDSNHLPHTLVCDVRQLDSDGHIKPSWSVDFGLPITCHYAVEQQESTLLGTSATPATYPMLLAGSTSSNVYRQTELHNDDTTAIACSVVTPEWFGGDLRSNDLWGDVLLDCGPEAAITAHPMNAQAAVTGVSATTIAAGSTRAQHLVSLGGGVLANFLGLKLTWTDDYATLTAPTTLYVWQPNFVPQPETTGDRWQDWDSFGEARWVQGFILDADTLGVAKQLAIRAGDDGVVQETITVTHSGRQQLAYSFTTPFIAHSIRLEPQSTGGLRLFGVRWITQPTPEATLVWTTQPTAHGIDGFQHVKQVAITYAATAAVTFTITATDGTSPTALTLPSTSGAVSKLILQLSPNKGLLYRYSLTSAAPVRPYVSASEVLVGAWGRSDSYRNVPLVGGVAGDKAEV